MSADAGLAQVAIMQKDSMSATPADVVLLEIMSNEDLEVTDFKGINIEALDLQLNNLKNLKLTASTPLMSLYMYMKLLSFRKGNCDIQIIRRDGKVFKFPGSTYPLGIKPKLNLTDDSRLIDVEIEAAFPKAVWDTIKTAALTAEPVVIASELDYSKQRTVYPLATECPIGTELYPSYEKRSMAIEPKETARVNILQSYNISNFNSLTANIDIQLDDVTLAEELAIDAKGYSPSLLWKDANGAATYDAFSFAANVLGMHVNSKDTGSKKTLTINYKRSFPISKMSGAYGTGSGGSASDNGVTGGTITIAA